MSARKKYAEMDRDELITALQIKDQSLDDWRGFRDSFIAMHKEWHEERERLQKRVADLEEELMKVGSRCTSYSDKLHYYRLGASHMEQRIRELEDELAKRE